MEDSVLLSATSSIDSILNRIGFGWYQVRVFIHQSWITYSDGAEIMVIALLTKILQNEWNLSDAEVELMGGILFFGMILGTFCSGPLGDKYGRRITLLFATLTLFLFGFASALMPGFWSFVVMRAVVGMSIGFLIPIQTAYEVEVNTEKSRAGFVIGTFLCFQLGMLSIVLLAFWLIPDLDSGNWRMMVIIASIPSGVSFVLQLFWMDESPRYLALNQEFEKANLILNKIARLNKASSLTEEEQVVVKATVKPEAESVLKRISRLFSSKYLKVSLQLFYLWFGAGFVYYGLNFILPRTLSSGSSDSEALVELAIINTLLIPAAILPCFLIENPSIGRRKTLLVCLLFQTIGCVICSFFANQVVFVSSVSIMLFLDLVYFDVIYPYTSEVYDTSIRSTGLSICSAWARFAGFVSPFVLLSLHEIDPTYPYIAFSVTSLVGLITCYMLKYESRGQNLDNFIDNSDKL